MKSTMTTNAALINIVNTQRYAIIDCLDDVVDLTRVDHFVRFETVDDMINANIDYVLNVVCVSWMKFDRSIIERFRNNVRFGSLVANNAINSDDDRVRDEARKLLVVTSILSRIVIELNKRVK